MRALSPESVRALEAVAAGRIVPNHRYVILRKAGLIDVRGHDHKSVAKITEAGRTLLAQGGALVVTLRASLRAALADADPGVLATVACLVVINFGGAAAYLAGWFAW